MNPPISNEQKWKDFLSSIDTYNTLGTTKLKITTKSNNGRLLATEFANKLKKKIPKTNENVQEKPEAISAQNADTIILEVPQTNINEHVKESSAQNADAIIPEVPHTDINDHVKETSAQNTDPIIPEVPQTDTNKYVKETSAEIADAIIPKVPQTDTNEHVKETSAQSADTIIPEVPETDTNEHMEEMSAQNDGAIIPEVSQTDTNEHVEEMSGQNANAIIPEVPQNDTNEHVKEMSTQSADAIIPEVSHTDTNEHVEEISGQSDDAIIPQVPQSIKIFKKLPTNILKLKTKGKKRSLATEFAYKLPKKEGDTVVSTGKAKSKDENIDNIDEPAKKQVRSHGSDDGNSESLLPIYDRAKIHHVDSQDSEDAIPPKIAKTNENVQEKPEAISTTFINPLVKRFDDRKGNVKETSAQNADDIIPQVPQTDTNEHVKETSAQNADSIIPEVSQTDTNENVKETSAQNADAIIPEVSQTDTNEHVKETSVQNADAIIPEGPQTDTNKHVKETSAQIADAIIPEVPQTDTNEHVKETSAQSADAVIPEVPQTDTNEHVEEMSAQNDGAIISEVSQTDTNEHVKEMSVQNEDAIFPEVPDTDANERVNETSAQNADAIIPEVSQTDTNEHVKELSAQMDDAIILQVPQTDKNEHVKETSAQNANAINPESPQTDTNEHVKEMSAQNDGAIIPEVSQITEINRSRYRDTHAPSKKSDIDKSCSKWNVLNIAEYFIFDDCVTEIKMPTGVPPNLDKIYEMVQKDIRLRLEIVPGINLKATERNLDSEFLIQLKSTTIAKAGNRLVLDALLIPLCSVLNLKLEVDKHIDCIFLPNSIFDYCIRKGEHIIGCIEAQSVKSLSDSSVAQAVLQLMILQTALIVTRMPEVEIEKFPVFAIVTDGHRFIYMQLKGSSLGFEYEGGKVRIRKVRKEDDFKDILRHISFLVDGF